jgi:hypothetical protein
MKLGDIIRPRQESIATARNVQGMPIRPLYMQRPQFHPRIGGPPTENYRKGHPTLTSPVARPALPVGTATGANQHQLAAYLKALNGR